MTATMTPAEPLAAADPALRMVPITANLLPVEIIEARRGRALRMHVLRGVGAVLVLVIAWYGLASYQTSAARDSLASAEAQSQRLLRQQRAFAELATTQAQSRAISAQLRTLLASDLQWSRLLDAVQAAAPKGVQITGVSGALAAGAKGGRTSAKATQLPSTSGDRTIGTLTVTGSASSKPAVAACVDALAKVEGLANPLLGSASLQNKAVQFTVRLDITSAALGGRYSAKRNNGSGNK
jgi:Tfp pilus assembly protein PilN